MNGNPARCRPAPAFIRCLRCPVSIYSSQATEADLDLKPMYDAPHYKGSEKLIDKSRS